MADEQDFRTISSRPRPTQLNELRRAREPVPVLTIVEGPRMGFQLVLLPEKLEIKVGRDPEADFSLDDDTVSRNHAILQVRRDAEGLHLELSDLDSTNGTFLNGEEVKHAKVRAGDKIHFGDVLVRYDLWDPLDVRYQYSLASRAEAAETDPLTGLKSRRFLMEEVGDLVSLYSHQEIELALLMIDLDHFKDINDTYGHPKGDAALKEVAEIILAQVRRSDIVVRYGGEEILVLLRGDRQAAAAVAERICRAVEQHDYRRIDNAMKITVSIGGAQLEKNDKLEELVARADQALYEAKKGGRNRVIWSIAKEEE